MPSPHRTTPLQCLDPTPHVPAAHCSARSLNACVRFPCEGSPNLAKAHIRELDFHTSARMRLWPRVSTNSLTEVFSTLATQPTHEAAHAAVAVREAVRVGTS